METTTYTHANRRRRKAMKWDKPVSRKFYFYLKDQVSIAGTYCKQIDETKVMTALEEYINGYAYVKPLNDVEKVVIKLLLPLIEKARERSRRAREAAARRRQALETAPEIKTETDIEHQPETTPPHDSAVEAQMHQRRESKRELRRLKHLKRMARRGCMTSDTHTQIPIPLASEG